MHMRLAFQAHSPRGLVSVSRLSQGLPSYARFERRFVPGQMGCPSNCSNILSVKLISNDGQDAGLQSKHDDRDDVID